MDLKQCWLTLIVLASTILPAYAADEKSQIDMIKEMTSNRDPMEILRAHPDLLDDSFFGRCEERIRWGLENAQIDDAIRFSALADSAARVVGRNGCQYRMMLVRFFLQPGTQMLAREVLTDTVTSLEPDF